MLLLSVAVALFRLVEIAARPGERHQHKLNLSPFTVRQPDENGLGRHIKATGQNAAAGPGRSWVGQAQYLAHGSAEVLVVVVAGQSHDGPAVHQEWPKDFAQVFDRGAKFVRPAQLAEQIARNEKDLG